MLGASLYVLTFGLLVLLDTQHCKCNDFAPVSLVRFDFISFNTHATTGTLNIRSLSLLTSHFPFSAARRLSETHNTEEPASLHAPRHAPHSTLGSSRRSLLPHRSLP